MLRLKKDFLNFCTFIKSYLWLLYIYLKHKNHKRYFLYTNLYHFLYRMNYLTCQLLIKEELEKINNDLKSQNNNWEDGKKTAGSFASKVKNNLQLNRNSELSKKYADLIKRKILSNQLIKSFALPKINTWDNVHEISKEYALWQSILITHSCLLEDQTYHLLFH